MNRVEIAMVVTAGVFVILLLTIGTMFTFYPETFDAITNTLQTPRDKMMRQ